MPDPQIKSRQRVRDLAEVYTNEREVKAMLNLTRGMFPTPGNPLNIDKVFLEPACGDGNFIEEILRRKLKYIKPNHADLGEYEYSILRAVASIYGIDISDDNRFECEERIKAVIHSKVCQELHTYEVSDGFQEALNVILSTNIVCDDTLAHAANIIFVEYKPVGDRMFLRSWSHALVPGNEAHAADSRPVHYAELLDHRKPV